jgi:histidine phosphotransferase ChpT
MLSTTVSSAADPPHDQAADLGALVGSRICHDLISPLGAIGNGVELIALTGQEPSPEISLIADSVESANARIRFFRVAFGAAGDDQTIGAQEISAIVEGQSRTGRHRIDWDAGGAARMEVKLAFLVILCLESAMPWGGDIRVSRSGEGWRIAGVAERVKRDGSLWDALGDPAARLAVSSSEVEFPLARDAALRLGRTISVAVEERGLAVSF